MAKHIHVHLHDAVLKPVKRSSKDKLFLGNKRKWLSEVKSRHPDAVITEKSGRYYAKVGPDIVAEYSSAGTELNWVDAGKWYVRNLSGQTVKTCESEAEAILYITKHPTERLHIWNAEKGSKDSTTKDSRKLIRTETGTGKAMVKVYYDEEWEEYQCELFLRKPQGWVLQTKATYHTDDKQDALSTSKDMVRRAEAAVKDSEALQRAKQELSKAKSEEARLDAEIDKAEERGAATPALRQKQQNAASEVSRLEKLVKTLSGSTDAGFTEYNPREVARLDSTIKELEEQVALYRKEGDKPNRLKQAEMLLQQAKKERTKYRDKK